MPQDPLPLPCSGIAHTYGSCLLRQGLSSSIWVLVEAWNEVSVDVSKASASSLLVFSPFQYPRVVVLEVWSMHPWESLRPFQGAHEVKKKKSPFSLQCWAIIYFFCSVDGCFDGEKAMVNQIIGTITQTYSNIKLYQQELCSLPMYMHRKRGGNFTQ